MAMLAEKRRKTRFVLQPTSKPIWTAETSGVQTGMKMMEKMGWSAGKGLGAREQGISEPIRAVFKQDAKGVGFKGDGNPFHNQDEFNAILANLAATNMVESEEAVTFESLEEKSKKSKTRVHYKKFTRGKDLSRYSTVDLACIVGNGKKEEVEEEDASEELNKPGETENAFGVTTVHGGSIADYFRKKWKPNKNEPVDERLEQSSGLGYNSELPESDELASVESSKSSKKKENKQEKGGSEHESDDQGTHCRSSKYSKNSFVKSSIEDEFSRGETEEDNLKQSGDYVTTEHLQTNYAEDYKLENGHKTNYEVEYENNIHIKKKKRKEKKAEVDDSNLTESTVRTRKKRTNENNADVNEADETSSYSSTTKRKKLINNDSDHETKDQTPAEGLLKNIDSEIYDGGLEIENSIEEAQCGIAEGKPKKKKKSTKNKEFVEQIEEGGGNWSPIISSKVSLVDEKSSDQKRTNQNNADVNEADEKSSYSSTTKRKKLTNNDFDHETRDQTQTEGLLKNIDSEIYDGGLEIENSIEEAQCGIAEGKPKKKRKSRKNKAEGIVEHIEEGGGNWSPSKVSLVDEISSDPEKVRSKKTKLGDLEISAVQLSTSHDENSEVALRARKGKKSKYEGNTESEDKYSEETLTTTNAKGTSVVLEVAENTKARNKKGNKAEDITAETAENYDNEATIVENSNCQEVEVSRKKKKRDKRTLESTEKYDEECCSIGTLDISVRLERKKTKSEESEQNSNATDCRELPHGSREETEAENIEVRVKKSKKRKNQDADDAAEGAVESARRRKEKHSKNESEPDAEDLEISSTVIKKKKRKQELTENGEKHGESNEALVQVEAKVRKVAKKFPGSSLEHLPGYGVKT